MNQITHPRPSVPAVELNRSPSAFLIVAIIAYWCCALLLQPSRTLDNLASGLWLSLVTLGPILLLLLVIMWRRPQAGKDLLAFCAVYVLYIIQLQAPNPNLFTFGLHWNWLGKFLALLLTLFWLIRIDTQTALPLQWRISWTNLITLLLPFGALLALITFGHHFDWARGMADFERLLFQSSMPGLDEELLFNGVLLGLLCRAIGTDNKNHREWVCGLMTAILFTLGHIIKLQGINVVFHWESLPVIVGGLMLAYVRIQSKTLWLPIIAHNAINLTALFFGMM